jgi:hypothetical protein
VESGLKVLENRVLRGMFGPTKNEIIGGWGKLHSKKLHNLHYSPNIIKVTKSRSNEWAGYVAYMRANE